MLIPVHATLSFLRRRKPDVEHARRTISVPDLKYRNRVRLDIHKGSPRPALKIDDQELLTRVAEIEAVEGRDFPRTKPGPEIVTLHELPGLRIYIRQDGIAESDQNINCVPMELHFDISSRLLLEKISQAMQANNNRIAVAAVAPALAHCWGPYGDVWPHLPNRTIRIHHMGSNAGSMSYSSRMSADGYEVIVELGAR